MGKLGLHDAANLIEHAARQFANCPKIEFVTDTPESSDVPK